MKELPQELQKEFLKGLPGIFVLNSPKEFLNKYAENISKAYSNKLPEEFLITTTDRTTEGIAEGSLNTIAGKIYFKEILRNRHISCKINFRGVPREINRVIKVLGFPKKFL